MRSSFSLTTAAAAASALGASSAAPTAPEGFTIASADAWSRDPINPIATFADLSLPSSSTGTPSMLSDPEKMSPSGTTEGIDNENRVGQSIHARNSTNGAPENPKEDDEPPIGAWVGSFVPAGLLITFALCSCCGGKGCIGKACRGLKRREVEQSDEVELPHIRQPRPEQA